MSVKTNELPQAAAMADSDSFVATTSQGTKRISLSLLKQICEKLFAPNGFGLGQSTGRPIPDNDFNNATENGWFVCTGSESNGPAYLQPGQTFGAILIVASARADLVKVQTLMLGTAGLQGLCLRRYYHNIQQTWQPWEWQNPPLSPGTEYCTTERYNGKPVYTKLVVFGKLPNTTASSVAHGITSIETIVSVSGSTSDKKNIPTLNYGGGSSMDDVIDVLVDPTNVTIYAARDRSNATANVLIRYTKTADE